MRRTVGRNPQPNNSERLLELAELAAKEQDPRKLLPIIREINEILEAKHRLLNELNSNPKKS
jgi:hypothetical protein